MEKSYGTSNTALADYVLSTFSHPDPILSEIPSRQAKAGLPDIQVGIMDGVHLEVLAAATGATRAVEIGTLGGYSGICLLRGMGPKGYLHTFELDPRHAAVAAESFKRAGLEARVKIHIGPAAERLTDIEREGPFDLVFIDADKPGYPLYLDWAATNLRVGGMVLGDNAFLFGHVADQASGEEAPRIRAMQAFNTTLAKGGRFRATMLPTAEGLAMGVKLR